MKERYRTLSAVMLMLIRENNGKEAVKNYIQKIPYSEFGWNEKEQR